MIQVFHHYKKWEDFQNGMYRKVNASDDHFLCDKATELLSNPDICFQAMKRVTIEWPFSTEHNLTNLGQNRRAWLGQAACCLEFGVPEELTKIAWNALDHRQQENANGVADVIIKQWEQCRKDI